MLTLGQELGVEDLQNSCEEHVTSTMSVLNACTFLATAMDIQDRASSKYKFIEKDGTHFIRVSDKQR